MTDGFDCCAFGIWRYMCAVCENGVYPTFTVVSLENMKSNPLELGGIHFFQQSHAVVDIYVNPQSIRSKNAISFARHEALCSREALERRYIFKAACLKNGVFAGCFTSVGKWVTYIYILCRYIYIYIYLFIYIIYTYISLYIPQYPHVCWSLLLPVAVPFHPYLTWSWGFRVSPRGWMPLQKSQWYHNSGYIPLSYTNGDSMCN